MDAYYTLQKSASQEIKIKGSRFIGYAKSVDSQHEAETFISEISQKHHHATHISYAYRVGRGDGSIFRYHDAGEPAGTAGKPILDAIEGRDLTNVVCVIGRYFGGTKLGTGGLAKAYGECARQTLSRGGKIERFVTVAYRIVFDYDFTGVIMHLVARYSCQIIETVYGEKTELVLQIRQSRMHAFEQDALNNTNGQVNLLREEASDY
ncbi:YigZ family protein [bacterium]|nr:YigZ family protein [bacterium]RQV94335.1 MAG: YigZ family protein [bacterium]